MNNQITIRAVEPEDAQTMYEAESDPEAWKYSDYLAPLSMEMLSQYALTYDADPLRAGQLRLIIDADGIPAGILDLFDISARHLRADSGIYLFPKFRGRGIATESLRKLMEYCRDRLGLHQLVATVSEQNKDAVRCYLNAGFSQSGTRPDWLRTAEGYESVIILYKIL